MSGKSRACNIKPKLVRRACGVMFLLNSLHHAELLTGCSGCNQPATRTLARTAEAGAVLVATLDVSHQSALLRVNQPKAEWTRM